MESIKDIFVLQQIALTIPKLLCKSFKIVCKFKNIVIFESTFHSTCIRIFCIFVMIWLFLVSLLGFADIYRRNMRLTVPCNSLCSQLWDFRLCNCLSCLLIRIEKKIVRFIVHENNFIRYFYFA